MGHLWYPTAGTDVGIDGEIELRDAATDQVRNFRIGVQSKATTKPWRSESESAFVFRAEPDDIEYWLGSNQPVLLVCSRPQDDEIYWRNVQEWARDPRRRATGLISFDKSKHAFDREAGSRLFSLETSEGPAVVYPPGPLPHPEVLLSNLLPIEWTCDDLWSVPCPADLDGGELFARSLEAGVPRSDVVIRRNRIWRLGKLEEEYLEAIEVGDAPEPTPLGEALESDDRDYELLVIQLIRRSLLARHHRELRWCGPEHLAYFRLSRDGGSRRFKWGRGRGREVVKPRQSRTHDGLSGYRHDAARLEPRRLADEWHVSVTPSYLFTHDGQKVSSFHASALKKMKEIDRTAAVSQQLRMWQTLLTRPVTVFEQEGDLPFELGAAVELEIAVTAPEPAWATPPRARLGASPKSRHATNCPWTIRTGRDGGHLHRRA